MDCKTTIELLPWLLNDTLEDAERAGVVEHLGRCADCRGELAETMAAYRAFGQHPTSAELVDLAFGQPVADRARIDQHLLACDDCAEHLALLRQSRALESERVLPFASPRASDVAHRGVSRHWRSAAVAAGLAAVLGAGGWLMSAREPRVVVLPSTRVASVAENQRVVADLASRHAQVESLTPDSVLRRSARPSVGGKIIALEPRDDLLVIELQQPDLSASHPGYLARLTDSDGKILLERPFEEPFGITLPIPVELLANGEHVIELYGLDGETRERVDRYPFVVELAADESPSIP